MQCGGGVEVGVCTLGDGVVTRFTECLVSEYLVLAEPAVLLFLVFAFVLFEFGNNEQMVVVLESSSLSGLFVCLLHNAPRALSSLLHAGESRKEKRVDVTNQRRK